MAPWDTAGRCAGVSDSRYARDTRFRGGSGPGADPGRRTRPPAPTAYDLISQARGARHQQWSAAPRDLGGDLGAASSSPWAKARAQAAWISGVDTGIPAAHADLYRRGVAAGSGAGSSSRLIGVLGGR
ncbi:hypothetical protein [Streptomyces sp. NPDC058701]|uniref:hypothetical protein n=1 Tax=Streptomyces sp. NPDC058701 TaxID=3346608 RepID=UPI003665A1E2